MSARPDGRIGSDELKARVEEHIGAAVYPEMFERAEGYARRKLDMANQREGRRYGEDGYGDDYLVLLMADTIRELAFSDYTNALSAARIAAQSQGRKCYNCKHYHTSAFCGYVQSLCKIHGSLDMDQHERHPDTEGARCPDWAAKGA